MVYEVISPKGRGTGTIIGVHTESPQCIDSLDMQKAMVAGGSKITFEGTEEEYEAVKNKLHPKTKVTIKKVPTQKKQKTEGKAAK